MTTLTTIQIAQRLNITRQMAHRIAVRLAAQAGIERQGRDWLIPAELVENYKPAKVGHPKGDTMWYILERDGQFQIVSSGSDPLHGRGSWNLHSGPYTTAEEAEAACPVV